MPDLREKLDDLEKAAFIAWQQAKRDGDEIEPALRRAFYFIETHINEFDGVEVDGPQSTL